MNNSINGKLNNNAERNKIVAKNSTENDWKKIDFLFHSAYSYPFVPTVDLSFVINELISAIRNRKHKKKNDEKNK